MMTIVNLGQSSLNYHDLKNDIVAVKPIISLWNDSIGIYKINNFNIDANKASDRIMQYLKLAAEIILLIILFTKPKN